MILLLSAAAGQILEPAPKVRCGKLVGLLRKRAGLNSIASFPYLGGFRIMF